MFLTQHETDTIKSTFAAMGSALRITCIASLEITAFTMVTAVDFYRAARPYAKQAWVIAMHIAAFSIAFCDLSYRYLKPRFMAWVDGVVESGYGQCEGGVCPAVLPDLPEDEEEFYPESERPDGTHTAFVADVYAPVAAKAMPETRLSILDVEKPVSKMNIRELRAYAVRQGIKGAGNMTKARILELMGV